MEPTNQAASDFAADILKIKALLKGEQKVKRIIALRKLQMVLAEWQRLAG